MYCALSIRIELRQMIKYTVLLWGLFSKRVNEKRERYIFNYLMHCVCTEYTQTVYSIDITHTYK